MDPDDVLTALLDSAALLGLDIRPDWREGVRTHLQVTLGLAAQVAAFDLPDSAEPAPVFVA